MGTPERLSNEDYEIGDDQFTQKELEEFEEAIEEIAEKAPGVLRNFKPEDMDPENNPTDAIMKPILERRDAAKKAVEGNE